MPAPISINFSISPVLLLFSSLTIASGKIVKRELVRWVTEGRVQPQPVHDGSPVTAEGGADARDRR